MSNPNYTLVLNAAGQAQYGMPTLEIDLRFGSTPFGYSFQLWQKASTGWQMLTSYGDWFQQDINPIIEEMNRVGIVQFITNKVIPWFINAIKNLFGSLVGLGAVPVPSTPTTTVITTANLHAVATAGLSEFVLQDRNGDGLPEMYRIE